MCINKALSVMAYLPSEFIARKPLSFTITVYE